MMRLARAAGIDAPEIRLVAPAGIEGLPHEAGACAARPSRSAASTAPREVHIEDFAQVFGVHPDAKYERASYRNIAEVLWAETGVSGDRRVHPPPDVQHAHRQRRQLVAHLPRPADGGDRTGLRFRLDIADISDARHALTLGRSKRMAELSLDQLAYLAGKARLLEKIVLDAARETAARFLDAWGQERKRCRWRRPQPPRSRRI